MSPTLILAAGLIALASCVSVLIYLLARSLATLPPEDRAWRDPPPRLWRPWWIAVRWLVPWIDPRIPTRWRASIEADLRRAGLEFSVHAGEYLALRLALGGTTAALGLACLWLIGVSMGGMGGPAVLLAALAGFCWPAIEVRDRSARRRAELLKGLPFFLDVITLCVEAGLNLQGALVQAASKGPAGSLRDELHRCLRDIRAGKGRSQALQAMADRVSEPGLSQFVSAVLQAESLGMSLGPVLRAQADQRRSERFLRAEKLAMQAPVKLLLPLIAFIFPCTFIVLFFPIAMKFLQPGL